MPRRATEREHNRGPVVVVSGAPGSGKTTYAKRLSSDLGLRYFTSGQIFRELARRLGVTLEELSRKAENDPSIDLAIDKEVVRIALEGGVVIDSHLAGWTLTGVADVLVLVKAHPAVRVARISNREKKSIGSVMRETFGRESSQWSRFASYYGYDILDTSGFDLVVDTSILGPDDVYAIIKQFVVAKLSRLGLLGPRDL
ncbi:MAG: AAA family ATPase [Desulfurococcales archaeon]|nr:AAA family ATPase [Desulfurococcales archaeon]